MENKFRSVITSQEPDFLQMLQKMMQVQSVKSNPSDNAPFGKGPKQALELVVKVGRSYGFKTGIINDAAAYVQWGDDDDHYIGIFGHLDVVPAGTNWSMPPFDLTKRGDRFYGRGILDNKGPSMACLYGMKLLKDMGVTMDHTIRLVFGSDEENGSADMSKYLAEESAPMYGFTPDCKYPAVYGERGIVNYAIKTPINKDELKQFKILNPEAQSSDHVPDSVKALINQKEMMINGKRSPSNAPEMGENALTLLAKELDDNQSFKGQLGDYFHWLASLHGEHYGIGLGVEFADEDSGMLIMTPYKLEIQSDSLVLFIAIRYPVSVTEDQVTKGIQKHVLPKSTIEIVRSMPGVMHSKDQFWIKQLSVAYEQATGLDGTPVTTTGATYAREVPNIIAFGPSFPGQKGIAHKQDEYMDEQDLLANMEIYMNAMVALGQGKDD